MLTTWKRTRLIEGTHIEARVFRECREIVERYGAGWVHVNGAAILPCV